MDEKELHRAVMNCLEALLLEGVAYAEMEIAAGRDPEPLAAAQELLRRARVRLGLGAPAP